MAVVPADQLTFSLIVEQYFLSLKGRGLMVSPMEQELIRGWESSGAPAWVVCRGIRAAFDSLERRSGSAGKVARSLSYCRKAVERSLDDWRDARLGARDQEPERGDDTP